MRGARVRGASRAEAARVAGAAGEEGATRLQAGATVAASIADGCSLYHNMCMHMWLQPLFHMVTGGGAGAGGAY